MKTLNLLMGDCLDKLSEVENKSVDLIVTDPPYCVETSGKGLYANGKRKYVEKIKSMSNGFSDEVLDLLCEKMKKINIYLFCSQKQIFHLIEYFHIKRGCNYNLLTWHKTNPVPACGNKYLTDTEFILFFREKGVKIYGDYYTKKTYFVQQRNTQESKQYNHPTCKPLNIIDNFIVNSSQEGDLVLDPFMGTGTTGVSCVKNNRNFIGIELNEEHFNTANKRIYNLLEN